jgi:hypothetical protein
MSLISVVTYEILKFVSVFKIRFVRASPGVQKRNEESNYYF